MAVLVHCGACGAEFRSHAKHRGKRTECARCAKPLVIDGPNIPDFDVFISYSTADRLAADAICAALEAERWRCWIAPRNVLPGSDWGASIIAGIEQSRLMVLVYSSHANQSQQVIREVERAVNKGLPLLPFRLEAVPPSKNMEYFLSTSHWMDAMTRPLEEHLGELAESVKSLLKVRGEEAGGDAAPVLRPTRRTGRRAVLAVVAAACVAGAAAAAAVMVSRSRARNENTIPVTQPATAPAAVSRPVVLSAPTLVVPRRGFKLVRGRREERFPVTIPELASGKGSLEAAVTNMGDNSGDGGMLCEILDAAGNVVVRRFSHKNLELVAVPVTSGSSWTVVIRDQDTSGPGNGGTIEVRIIPK